MNLQQLSLLKWELIHIVFYQNFLHCHEICIFCLNDCNRVEYDSGSHWSLLIFNRDSQTATHYNLAHNLNEGVAKQFLNSLRVNGMRGGHAGDAADQGPRVWLPCDRQSAGAGCPFDKWDEYSYTSPATYTTTANYFWSPSFEAPIAAENSWRVAVNRGNIKSKSKSRCKSRINLFTVVSKSSPDNQTSLPTDNFKDHFLLNSLSLL